MRYTTDDLARLLRRVADGDREAFDPLYSATSLKLFGIVLRILKRREIAEEVLQDVYYRIWRNAGRFDATLASPITWMATIARNRALDEVRRREPATVDSTPDVVDSIPDPGRDASELTELDEDFRRLQTCLDGLEPVRRDAIQLAYLDGLSRKELADRFGLPIGTIKTWLHRGLKQLKDCLGE